MTKRFCVCVGVTDHKDARLSQLIGAGVDATRMFAVLTDPGKGAYDKTSSVLLLNPIKQNVSEVLAD